MYWPAACRSMMTGSIPRRISSAASASPVGPAPTMRTSVSVFSVCMLTSCNSSYPWPYFRIFRRDTPTRAAISMTSAGFLPNCTIRQKFAHSLQLVRIANGVDRDDLGFLDVQGGSLQRSPAIDRNESWKAVDGSRPKPLRRPVGRLQGEASEKTRDPVSSVDRIERCRLLTAPVGIRHGIFSEQGTQLVQVAAGRGSKECARNRGALFAGERITRSL